MDLFYVNATHPRNRSSHDQTINLLRSFVGIQSFGVGEEAADVVGKEDSVSAHELFYLTFEGLVIRLLIEYNDSSIGRVSFKAINPEFLLKFGQ